MPRLLRVLRRLFFTLARSCETIFLSRSTSAWPALKVRACCSSAALRWACVSARLGILGGAAGIDDIPERGVFGGAAYLNTHDFSFARHAIPLSHFDRPALATLIPAPKTN